MLQMLFGGIILVQNINILNIQFDKTKTRSFSSLMRKLMSSVNLKSVTRIKDHTKLKIFCIEN